MRPPRCWHLPQSCRQSPHRWQGPPRGCGRRAFPKHQPTWPWPERPIGSMPRPEAARPHPAMRPCPWAPCNLGIAHGWCRFVHARNGLWPKPHRHCPDEIESGARHCLRQRASLSPLDPRPLADSKSAHLLRKSPESNPVHRGRLFRSRLQRLPLPLQQIAPDLWPGYAGLCGQCPNALLGHPLQ